MRIRLATQADWPGIWAMLQPVFRAGETYAVPRDITEAAAQAMWMQAPAATLVAETDRLVGTYYIKTNHAGPAAHICNCGYVTAEDARGQGVASAMCAESLQRARDMGYQAMQFNLVLASNAGAVRLWQHHGFTIAGTLPDAFDHPRLGLVAAHVMWRQLQPQLL